MTKKLKGLYILNRDSFEDIYPEAVRERISEYVDIISPLLTREAVAVCLSGCSGLTM